MEYFILGNVEKKQLKNDDEFVDNSLFYKKILNTDLEVFSFNKEEINVIPYNPETLLDENDFFCLENFSQKKYFLNIFRTELSSATYNEIEKDDLNKLNFILVISKDYIFIQKITKSYIARKKFIIFGDSYVLEDSPKILFFKNNPDAIYSKKENTLYFKKLENLTTIFKGIDELYKEATIEETKDFIENNFINLDLNFSVENIGKTNRKRISMISKKLKELTAEQKNNLLEYIKPYCLDIPFQKNKFKISSNIQQTKLLYGFQERYFTTFVSDESYIANSIIKL